MRTDFPLNVLGYSIRMTAKPIKPGQYMWAVRRDGETLFHRTREELDPKLLKSSKPTLLNEQRANLIGLLNSRVETLSAGATHRTATGRFSSNSPIQNMRTSKSVSGWVENIIKEALASKPQISDILGSTAMAEDKNKYRKEELSAVLDDLKAQQKHFASLGQGKPADDEYNLKANGYLRILDQWSALHSYLATKKL